MPDRRDFLKFSALAVAATTGMPGFLARAAAQAGGYKTLVVIQLTGGNDGLNTLVPYSNGAYYAARPTIAIPSKDVLTLGPDLGMHPALKPLMGLWDAGQLAWMENVGYPNPNRSHFASMAIWHTADPTQARGRGLDRADCREDRRSLLRLAISAPRTPLALRAAEFSLPSIERRGHLSGQAAAGPRGRLEACSTPSATARPTTWCGPPARC